jgi:hypothetical protein
VNDAVVDLSGEMTEPVVVKLASAGAIAGTMQPKLSGARVSIAPTARDREATRFVYTDADGHFDVAGLRPGRYRVVVAGAPAVEVDVKGGEPAPVRIAAATMAERQ